MEKIRLQKVIRDSLNCSRRKAEEFIISGQVFVNGKPASLGDKVDIKLDSIKVFNRYIKPVINKKFVYIKLYKPRGYITSLKDEKNRKCVVDLIKNVNSRVFPIGRLDYTSEGLLLLTNDGDFANKITNPKSHIAKTYRVTITPIVSEDILNAISNGVMVDGVKTRPSKINIVSLFGNRCILDVTIYEGKNRQIHKMFEQFGYKILRLKRISIGKIKIGDLKPSQFKFLSKNEIEYFK